MSQMLGVLIADEFEDDEFWYPKLFFEARGVDVRVIGSEVKRYEGKKGSTATADVKVSSVSVKDLDALHIPGGYAPDKMRRNQAMVDLVADMHEDGSPIAAICHAGWMLISAGVIDGKTVTGYYSIQDDIENAGATYVDQNVVVEDGLITSRYPADLPFYCDALAVALGFEADDRLQGE